VIGRQEKITPSIIFHHPLKLDSQILAEPPAVEHSIGCLGDPQFGHTNLKQGNLFLVAFLYLFLFLFFAFAFYVFLCYFFFSFLASFHFLFFLFLGSRLQFIDLVFDEAGNRDQLNEALQVRGVKELSARVTHLLRIDRVHLPSQPQHLLEIHVPRRCRGCLDLSQDS